MSGTRIPSAPVASTALTAAIRAGDEEAFNYLAAPGVRYVPVDGEHELLPWATAPQFRRPRPSQPVAECLNDASDN